MNVMRYEYRITKYNPANRDINGFYPVDDWTQYSDIGKTFRGEKFTRQEYLRVEELYLAAIKNFLVEANIQELRISQLHNFKNLKIENLQIRNGVPLNLAQIIIFSRLALREKIWGKLVATRRAYIHFGWDYYLYMGVSRKCSHAIDTTLAQGLFIEPMRSPYLRRR